jgi:DNA-binding CsgD family transcriptional regulator
MRKKQRTFIKKAKYSELDNVGMPFEDYVSLDQKSFKEWETGDDYNERRSEQQEEIERLYRSLSPREKQVFQLLSQGAVEEQIASILHISRSRVQNIRRRIVNKYGIKTPENGTTCGGTYGNE